MSAQPEPYRGRFAPTPSGPLHLGSLLMALASWLAARQAGGTWLLRIDDLDRPRCAPGAETAILTQLETHGLHWDETPLRQSEHVARYEDLLSQLRVRGWLYACTCTRAQLQASARSGPDGPIYPGTCRHLDLPHPGAALRLCVPARHVTWHDGIQGFVQRDVLMACGDFTVRRSDGQIGYHLACAADESHMGITEVLRGADLLGSTAQQLLLAEIMAWPPPRYAHLPVLIAHDGRKLSKQNGAAALRCDAAAVQAQLRFCLSALEIPDPPRALTTAESLLEWAIPHWQPARLIGRLTLTRDVAALP